MELNVTIINLLKYNDKQTGEPKLRIGYILPDKQYFKDTARFKGYPEFSIFIDNGDENFGKIPASLIFQPCTFKFISRPSALNPVRQVNTLEEIVTKNGTIKLL